MTSNGEPLAGLALHARQDPARPALILGERTLTYGELDDRARRLAIALAGLGLGAGDRIAAMLPNGFEFFEVSQGVAKLRANLIPINWHLRAHELRWILTDSGARVLVADSRFREEADRAAEGLEALRTVWVGDADGLRYGDLLADADPKTPLRPGLPHTPYMFYTSGTTGKPKGAVDHTGGQAAARQIKALVGALDLRGDDVHILAGPAYHAAPGGWANIYLSLGATTVILPRWDARTWLSLVQRLRATTAFLVPTHFIRLHELAAQERERFDVSSLRLILHAGEACPVPIKRRVLEMFPEAEIVDYYGGSEAGAATIIRRDDWLRHPGSVGRAIEGVSIKILDDDGAELPPGESGHIYYTPWGRTSYHNDPQKTAGAWRHDVFTVGDIGRLDEHGYLYLTDRRDDLIVRGGVNVYPREIEDVLIAHPAVADCAVFGVPDARYGQAVKAMVESRSPVGAEDLRAYCSERLAEFKCPELIELVDRLPRDPSGKIRKRMLRGG